MSNNDIYKIRPAGRHVLTIGRDLIQDRFAAIVELVKNSYDADSNDVTIVFRSNELKDYIEIIVEDHGHGMSRDDVIKKWLVPSTNYKFSTRHSPSGRVMQGRKGIGRYAASILGNDLLMETVDQHGEKTVLYIDWKQFEQHEYLDQVDVIIESDQSSERSGTRLTMRGTNSEYLQWTPQQLDRLKFELKKLIPPKVEGLFDDSFRIKLFFENFLPNQVEIVTEEIEPYPILDLFDYKIYGIVQADGECDLQYTNQKAKNTIEEKIHLSIGDTHCGKIVIDIRVYDRDKDSIDSLILRGLKDKENNYVTKLDARRLLNDVNGIGVYRNGFRIRPLGDADFDWLKLNEQRVQNPSLRIGSNQVVGYVYIESEEASELEEKSARDGLRDNKAYQQLKSITCAVIAELEQRRFNYRRSIGLENPGLKIERTLQGLYDYSALNKSIKTTLRKAGFSDSVANEIDTLISREQRDKNEAVAEIQKAVAIYQGQATLGKIINIILHEGRRPLNYFKNQVPNLDYYSCKFLSVPDDDSYNQIATLSKGIEDNAGIFVQLFGRLDPLAAKKRETKSNFPLAATLKSIASVFEHELNINKIKIEVKCNMEMVFSGWKQDLYTIFTNLIDNSIFWIVEKQCDSRHIILSLVANGEKWIIDYEDSGPGIEPRLLESQVIFEPQFTTKPSGTGLGLSIAGEAAQRNGLVLTALQKDDGAHFRLSLD